MVTLPTDYPWFSDNTEDDLEQGDIFENCPVFLPPPDLAEEALDRATFSYKYRDVILMSQSCDLVKDRPKVSDVLLCALWRQSDFKNGHLSTPRGMEDARRGNLPNYHVLAASSLPNHTSEVRVVDFRGVYSLPLAFVRKLAARAPHLRLLPPYREHLSQAFARHFMRVGLPVGIPAFWER